MPTAAEWVTVFAIFVAGVILGRITMAFQYARFRASAAARAKQQQRAVSSGADASSPSVGRKKAARASR